MYIYKVSRQINQQFNITIDCYQKHGQKIRKEGAIQYKKRTYYFKEAASTIYGANNSSLHDEIENTINI